MKIMKFECVCAIFLMVSLASVHAQTIEKKKGDPLRIAIKIDTREFCSNNSISITAKVTNTSQRLIEIDRKSIWYAMSFTSLRIESNTVRSESREYLNDPSDRDRDRTSLVTLKPIVRKSFSDSFFQLPGDYGFQTTYGQFGNGLLDDGRLWRGSVVSDLAKFQIPVCREKGRS